MVGRAFIDEVRVRLPATVRLLLRGQPLLSPLDQSRIHIMYARHVGELHQAVRRQDLVGGRIAEPREPAAGNFESQQALIPVGDEALGLGMHFGSQFLGAFHVIEGQHVWVSGG